MRLKFIRSQFIGDCRGLTLIEVSMAILILGLLLLPLAKMYDVYRIQEAKSRSDGNIQVIQSALQKFALRNGRYPIPAQRDLAPADAGFGQEYAGAINNCGGGDVLPCRAAGFNATNDPILIGDVPFAALGLPQHFIKDGYGNKFTYAVTENQTADPPTPGDFDSKGSIRVIDRTGADTEGTSSDVHYVVISHGENGKGTFSLEGVLIQACAGAGSDNENCDNDGLFNNNFDMIGTGSEAVYARFSAHAVGTADYYDDYLRFSVTTAGDIWTRTAASPDIHNRNGAEGNVRIGPNADFNGDTVVNGNDLPNAKVEVVGNISADSLQTNRLCRYDVGCEALGSTAGLAMPNYAPEEFHPGIIGDTPNNANSNRAGGGILCGEQAMTGISDADEECDYDEIPITLGLTNCPPNTWARGTTAAGDLNCVAP